jgi:type II secretory pathway component PulF
MTIAWCIVAVFALMLISGLLYMVLPLATILGPLVAMVLIVLAGEAARMIRQQRAMSILSYLEQAVRLNLPLGTMLGGAVASEKGATKRRLTYFRNLLQQGIPISTALSTAVPEVSDRAVGLIGTAEKTGTLRQTLARLLMQNRRAEPEDSPRRGLNRVYATAYPLIILVLIAVGATYFRILFRDFKISLPPVTRFLLRASGTTVWVIFAILSIIVLIMAGRAIERFFQVRSSLHGVLKGITDRLIWRMPFAGRVARDAGMADLCETLSDAMEGHQSFVQSLEKAEGLYLNAVLAGRVRRWRDLMLAGTSAADAAQAAKMPRLAVGLLAGAQRGDNAESVFRFLARYYRSRYSRALALINGAMIPAVALAMGVCVCATALAVYLPYIQLSEQVSQGIPR